MSRLSGWRLPLRLARRDALRHRRRSALVLVMIALPVLGVTAADVVIATSDVSDVEGLDRRLGAAAALAEVQRGLGSVQQAPDPESGYGGSGGGGGGGAGRSGLLGADRLAQELDGGRLVELRRGDAQVATDGGRAYASVLEVDLADPVTRGVAELVSGRLPTSPDEVVVNQALLDEGYAVGDVLEATQAGEPVEPRVVGVAESATLRDQPFAAGPLGAFAVPVENSRSWLVDGPPVTWAEVGDLNELGVLVTSRAVIEDPPPDSAVPDAFGAGSTDSTVVAVVVLVVVMALLEVVLLAGPAFAVGARRQQRTLALLAAAGGTPVQARRVVLAGAVVLGGAAAVTGVVLGIGAARLLVPGVQRYSSVWFGPFEVPWLHVVGIAGFGLLSALLAAVVPAVIASRQDVVAVLAGRRGDRRPSVRSPIVGLLLLAVGVGGSAFGAVSSGDGALVIAASAVLAVLGMILLVPPVLAGLARAAGRMPLAVRYAVRDAARHRTRTVPAVAAVAATVAGVVALGIGMTSDEAENEATYVASVAAGVGVVTKYDASVPWEPLRTAVTRAVPGALVEETLGLPSEVDGGFVEVRVEVPGVRDALQSYGSSLGGSVLVSEAEVPVGLVGVSEAEAARAHQVLRRGGVVGFVMSGVDPAADRAEVVRKTFPASGGRPERVVRELDAEFVDVGTTWAGPSAVLSPAAARRLGVEPEVVALAVSGTSITEDQEEQLGEALLALSDTASVYVERGYQAADETVIAQLVLLGLGGVLMLGGTLTATFLALSDARPDLATLAAVGASPRTRRAVAAAYAGVVGGVGALLGAAVGFIPGVAVTWPLTARAGDTCTVQGSGGCSPTGDTSGPFLDVPWLMVLTLVVLLPAITALLVALVSRSRLPLVARLD